MSLARKLRRNSTQAEQKLWALLRNRKLERHKFRRQQPLGSYVVDFVCFEQRLIVEADGGQHNEQIAADTERTRWLEMQGFRVLRFWNNDVLSNPEGVFDSIQRARDTPHPLAAARDLSRKGRG
jgi:very-short-patch-repair endonuclease